MKQRKTAWALAALLLIPASGRASEYCGHDQATPQGKAQQANKPGDKHGDKSGEHRPAKWWIDPALRAELGITDAQSVAVEDVWQKSVPKLRELVHKNLLDFSGVEKELSGYDACFYCLGISSAGMSEHTRWMRYRMPSRTLAK